MALRTPPSWLQAGSYTAENDRLTQQAVFNTSGIIGTSSLAVTQQVVASLTLNIASGWAAILGGNTTTQGVYVAYNDATATVTLAAADPTNPRIDRIVVTVSDATYSGSTNQVVFSVLTGTAAPSPVAPSTPTNSISLATVAVAAGVTTITNANITDTRTVTVSNLSAFTTLTASGLITANGGVTTAGNTTVTLGGSTGTNPPLKLTSGTSITPASGAVEFDGTTAYFTPVAGSGRGILPSSYYYIQGSSGNTGANNQSAQPIFPGMTNGLAVQANTVYDVEIVAGLTSGNTTSKSWGIALAGTATSYGNNAEVLYGLHTGAVTSGTSLSAAWVTSGAFTVTGTHQSASISWKGSIRVNAAGYVLPTITFGTAPTSYTLQPGSYIKLTPVVSSSNATSSQAVGAWS
jgi:hypothetical protein